VGGGSGAARSGQSARHYLTVRIHALAGSPPSPLRTAATITSKSLPKKALQKKMERTGIEPVTSGLQILCGD
jgi:hypothetical protein